MAARSTIAMLRDSTLIRSCLFSPSRCPVVLRLVHEEEMVKIFHMRLIIGLSIELTMRVSKGYE